MTPDDIERIIYICKEYSTPEARAELATFFAEQENTAILAEQIKVTDKPEPQRIDPKIASTANAKSGFTKIATQWKAADGRVMDVYHADNNDGSADLHIRPHRDGRTLSEDEIKSVLQVWNAEAQDTVKDGLSDPYIANRIMEPK